MDGPDDMRREWFEGATTIALTSGASVPESLFAAVVASITHDSDARIEEHGLAEEAITFRLPMPVRVPLRRT